MTFVRSLDCRIHPDTSTTNDESVPQPAICDSDESEDSDNGD